MEVFSDAPLGLLQMQSRAARLLAAAAIVADYSRRIAAAPYSGNPAASV
jgi:hypothetical protein